MPVLVVAGFVFLLIFSVLLRNFLFPIPGLSPSVRAIAQIRGDFRQYLFYATFVAWGTAAVGEELLLRGFVMSRFERLLGANGRTSNTLAAVVLQAGLFGSFHWHQGADALIATGAGLILGLVWWAGGRNLWACIVLHGLVDTATYYNYYSGPQSAL